MFSGLAKSKLLHRQLERTGESSSVTAHGEYADHMKLLDNTLFWLLYFFSFCNPVLDQSLGKLLSASKFLQSKNEKPRFASRLDDDAAFCIYLSRNYERYSRYAYTLFVS